MAWAREKLQRGPGCPAQVQRGGAGHATRRPKIAIESLRAPRRACCGRGCCVGEGLGQQQNGTTHRRAQSRASRLSRAYVSLKGPAEPLGAAGLLPAPALQQVVVTDCTATGAGDECAKAATPEAHRQPGLQESAGGPPMGVPAAPAAALGRVLAIVRGSKPQTSLQRRKGRLTFGARRLALLIPVKHVPRKPRGKLAPRAPAGAQDIPGSRQRARHTRRAPAPARPATSPSKHPLEYKRRKQRALGQPPVGAPAPAGSPWVPANIAGRRDSSDGAV